VSTNARRATAGGAALLGAAWIAFAQPPLRAEEATDVAMGRELFDSIVPACSTCHALRATGAAGEVGPPLDELRPDAARVEKALRDGIGSMPSYRELLTDQQIRALALFVAQASAG
jgi:sulfite dehydrogenase